MFFRGIPRSGLQFSRRLVESGSPGLGDISRIASFRAALFDDESRGHGHTVEETDSAEPLETGNVRAAV